MTGMVKWSRSEPNLQIVPVVVASGREQGGMVADAQARLVDLVAEYRRQAEEAEGLAECVLWEEQRQLILEMAHTWRTMADQRESLLKRGLGKKIPLNGEAS
jgi:hypothetical protein